MPPNATVAGVNFTGKILKWSISVGPYQNKVLTPKKIISTNGECTRANDWPTVKDKAYLGASIIRLYPGISADLSTDPYYSSTYRVPVPTPLRYSQ